MSEHCKNSSEEFFLKARDLLGRWSHLSFTVGLFDFVDGTQKTKSYLPIKTSQDFDSPLYDVASITKMLTLTSLVLKKREIFNPKLQMLCEHRAGLPTWGILDGKTWRDQILSYSLTESDVHYSDFSLLRAQIELERETGQTLESLMGKELEEFGIYHWTRLKEKKWKCPITGHRNGQLIRGDVHDDNAYKIKLFLAHAGLFSTGESLAQYFLSLEQKHHLLSFMKKEMNTEKRFVWGADTSRGQSLVGHDHTGEVFGHTGFTGCYIWMDVNLKAGVLLLSNYCLHAWFDREDFNQVRREIATNAWRYFGKKRAKNGHCE